MGERVGVKGPHRRAPMAVVGTILSVVCVVVLCTPISGASTPSAAPLVLRHPYAALTSYAYPSNITQGCETLTVATAPWANATAGQAGVSASGTAQTCSSTLAAPAADLAAPMGFEYAFTGSGSMLHIRAELSNLVSGNWSNHLGTCVIGVSSWSYCLADTEFQAHQFLVLTDTTTSQQFYSATGWNAWWGYFWEKLCVYSNCSVTNSGPSKVGHLLPTVFRDTLTLNVRLTAGHSYVLSVDSVFWILVGANYYSSNTVTTYTGFAGACSLRAEVTLLSLSLS
jgi:hypothetical protein